MFHFLTNLQCTNKGPEDESMYFNIRRRESKITPASIVSSISQLDISKCSIIRQPGLPSC